MDLAASVRKACCGRRRKRSRPYERVVRPSRTSSLLRRWMSQLCCTSRACTSSLSASDQSLLQPGCCTRPRGAHGMGGAVDVRDEEMEAYGQEVWMGVGDDEEEEERKQEVEVEVEANEGEEEKNSDAEIGDDDDDDDDNDGDSDDGNTSDDDEDVDANDDDDDEDDREQKEERGEGVVGMSLNRIIVDNEWVMKKRWNLTLGSLVFGGVA
ncbi:phosphopantothenoylcysteine decarboxylase subunit VHS3-like [Astyanax mexicanus]|uniref:Phosphopantothenoylcysteine decarboxylase subunit VHS3-like n=1 Tax=Astyanax mexicanus TaxID=7994 RepID=A0A8T2M7F0_ASTMX|nr:phosphopantothenoylcysteine decarboxylase subunit VHS3-like [Astyanax mexicanus]